jgi:hypothetical protein
LEAFHTLAEISVAIAGFSSLIIVLRGNSVDWTRQDYLNFGYVLSWSIGCIFLSLLPLILVEFNMETSTAARIGLFATAGYMLAVGGILGIARRRIVGKTLSLWRSAIGPGRIGIGMTLSAQMMVCVALLAGLGLLPGPTPAWYALAIVWLMAHAVAEMGVFVALNRQRTY